MPARTIDAERLVERDDRVRRVHRHLQRSADEEAATVIARSVADDRRAVADDEFGISAGGRGEEAAAGAGGVVADFAFDDLEIAGAGEIDAAAGAEVIRIAERDGQETQL